MLSYCFYVIMTRQMGATETPESLIFYSALAPVVLMLPVVPLHGVVAAWTPCTGSILLSLGVYGGIGHWF